MSLESFVHSKEFTVLKFQHNNYSFYIHHPLSHLSAHTFSSASGGPCIQDNKIVALASYGSSSVFDESCYVNMTEKMPVYPSFKGVEQSQDNITNTKVESWLDYNLSQPEGPYDESFAQAYFEKAENILQTQTKTKLFLGNISCIYFTPLYYSKEWVVKTLNELN